MYISTNTDYYATACGDVLTVYDSKNVADHNIYEFRSSISSLYAAENFVIVGLFSGKIIVVDRMLKWEYEIHNLRGRVRCIFRCGKMFYFGSDEAKIAVILIRNENNEELYYEDSDLSLDSSFIKSQHGFEHRVMNEIVHNAPIISIAVDGDITYVLDMKGRIMVYPDRFAYDIHATCMSFKKYLFASEKNYLYCKTSEAFSCILTMIDDIIEFKFSHKGGILLVRTHKNVHVYNRNFKEIRKISIGKSAFAFDEHSNRLVIYDGDHISFINNIVGSISHLCEEMDNIFFEKTHLNEKVVRNETDYEEEQVSRFVDDGNLQKIHTVKKSKRNVEIPMDLDKHYERLDDSTDDELHYNNKLNLFEEEIEDESESEEVKKVIRPQHSMIEPFMSGSIILNETELLCYNKIGYVIRRNDEIEIIYHDTSRPRKTYKEDYKSASLSENGILFVSNSKDLLIFIGENTWEKEIYDIKLIFMTNKCIVCVTANDLHIFKFSGIKIFSCLIRDPITLSAESENIVLFCHNKIMHFDRDFNVKQFDFWHNLTFCILDRNTIYYTYENQMYMFKDGLSVKMMKIGGYPLCINNGHLITCNGRITDTPNIEFFAIKSADMYVNLAMTIEEREEFIIKKIEEAFAKKDHILMSDLADLLRLDSNIQKIRLHLLKADEPEVNLTNLIDIEDENTSEYNQENKIIKQSKSTATPIKTKRYNAFARK